MPDAELAALFAEIIKVGGPAGLLAGAVAWRLVVGADSKLGLAYLRRKLREVLGIVAELLTDTAELREELRQTKQELAQLRTRVNGLEAADDEPNQNSAP